ncbi:DUF1223 domain-containing protein [Oryzicola mucosus]|uniref:DUF1223 domain-containing protein n=1 Tax=Oryzicola mucosus TaxID=2767425 RepID=A0A8J6PTL0_9HYPH|nr:DUF1223 domain-containing protein [Oryzicola mucosus]MBD0413813.1 DUF1223 domain-containing protein [Oryzicola mucosus]
MRRISITLAALLAASAVAGSAFAEDGKPVGVVELFTSQGCNSCPPADALFSEYAKRSDIVALAYHVNYWDYLGWRDTLATEENTARQNDYMRSFKSRSVYTPQAVVNGRVHVNGAKRQALADTLGKMQSDGNGLSVPISISKQGDSMLIETGSSADGEFPSDKEAHLVLVHFDAPRPITIDRGENQGREVTYWNSVTDIQTVGMWHGKAARFELPKKVMGKKGGCAVLLQEVDTEGLPGAILGAVVVRNFDSAAAPQ